MVESGFVRGREGALRFGKKEEISGELEVSGDGDDRSEGSWLIWEDLEEFWWRSVDGFGGIWRRAKGKEEEEEKALEVNESGHKVLKRSWRVDWYVFCFFWTTIGGVVGRFFEFGGGKVVKKV